MSTFIKITDSSGQTRYIQVSEIEEVLSTPDLAPEMCADTRVKCVVTMRSETRHNLHETAEDFMQRIERASGP